ncbi:hypothetical protein ACIPPS_12925 [Streptomyces sp. NPDC090127]|uniref:hypothetical protein n=1 Tax=Streptomyces sp. NPDC090127 TaxID=3365953 RepID=UPI00381701EA
MADITKIVAKTWTADVAEAKPASGTVYLGIAGREFAMETDGSDFDRDTFQEFVFGEDANVSNPEYNDPRMPQLTTADLDRYPAYIRLDGSDGWCLERATVTIEPGSENPHAFDNPDLVGVADNRRIWLRSDYGQVLGLRRTSGTADPGSGQGIAQPAGRRIVYGNINSDGSVQSGSGDFLVTKEGTGRYSIAFQRSFSSLPSANATLWGDGWNLVDNTQIAAIESGRIVVITGDYYGQYGDRGFSFQAIGS